MRFSFRKYKTRLQFVREAIAGKPLRFLDVGNLGDGESNCRIFHTEVEAAGGTYVGLDSNETLTKKMNLPNQVVGDLHQAPFGDQEFDAVYAGEIVEHTWSPGHMISECYRILKPGGLLILDTPNAFNLTRVARYYLRNEDSMGDVRMHTYHEAMDSFRHLKDRGDVLLQPQHKIFYTPAMLKQLLETHGFVPLLFGITQKPTSLLHRILLWIFPQSGRHLCCVARRASVEEAFQDVRNETTVY